METRSNVLQKLGETVREFRLARGLSQEALAELASVHRTYIGGVERGERNISFEAIAKIVSALELTWSEFAEALDERGPW